jgi:hypothetical protein
MSRRPHFARGPAHSRPSGSRVLAHPYENGALVKPPLLRHLHHPDAAVAASSHPPPVVDGTPPRAVRGTLGKVLVNVDQVALDSGQAFARRSSRRRPLHQPQPSSSRLGCLIPRPQCLWSCSIPPYLRLELQTGLQLVSQLRKIHNQ